MEQWQGSSSGGERTAQREERPALTKLQEPVLPALMYRTCYRGTCPQPALLRCPLHHFRWNETRHDTLSWELTLPVPLSCCLPEPLLGQAFP